MATAMSTPAPMVVRTSSTRANSGNSDTPSRHRSSGHHRSSSRSQPHDTPPISNQAALSNAGRRDQEAPNISRRLSGRRSSSRDRTEAGQQYHQESSRTRHRDRSRPSSSRNSTDMSAAATAVNTASVQSGPSSAHGERPGHAPVGRRRTSITTQTGTWSLGKTIGQGSMGKVKLAKNQETGEQVAIKIVPRQATDEHGHPKDERADRSKEVRTAREAAMVTLLDHPFICGMRDVQRTNYHWYMLFEYVNGGQMLDYIISHGRLKEKQARKFARQIASALDYCHKNSIVHRDLKIENILISKTGDIKIIDFGLSNLFAPRSLLKTFCGSLYFAAPELLQARQYTGPEVDIWSFGIVLYVLVCGKVPFDDQSMPQLHAKIKRGIVDYPQWLSHDCKSIISRMLVVDPKDRASLQEIMSHPWMTKGYNNPPETYLPMREPLQMPLDHEVIEKMTGFDFGTSAQITGQLHRILESEDYQAAVRRYLKEDGVSSLGEKKRGVFDFYKRRNSISREGLASSSDAIRTLDPTTAFHPLISIYYLAREKRDREKKQSNPGALALPTSPGEKPMLELSQPEAAYTNQNSYEIPGEKVTGGRSRPRARTHGDDEVIQDLEKLDVVGKHPPVTPTRITHSSEAAAKKDSGVGGLLRRFSTRRNKDRGADRQAAPVLNLQPPSEVGPPRKSFSVRRARRRDGSPPTTMHAGGSQPQQEGLLSASDAKAGGSRSSRFLGRSTSMNSGDYRPSRFKSGGASEGADSPRLGPEPPPTSGSDHSSLTGQQPSKGTLTETIAADATQLASPRTTTVRPRSLGNARRETIAARRQRREEAKDREENLPEETDAELREEAGESNEVPGAEQPNKVFLKGMMSVSTTSSKPLPFIRQDVIRVLKQLGVQFTEVKSGFTCRHAPSINLDKIRDPGSPPVGDDERSPRLLQGHQRRISFGGFRKDRDDEKMGRHSSRRGPPDRSFITNSEGSDEYVRTPKEGTNPDATKDAAGTTTRVQADTGANMILKFDVNIVKVPWFNLHGIQFKKVQGGMNQYKHMADRIVASLRL